MATYFLLGKYSQDSLKHISSARTKKVTETLEKLGGRIKSIYALLGEKDVAVIVDLPGCGAAVKASLALAKATGIGFTTSEAVSIEEFDKLAKDI